MIRSPSDACWNCTLAPNTTPLWRFRFQLPGFERHARHLWRASPMIHEGPRGHRASDTTRGHATSDHGRANG
eukprot:9234415-Lingulodinium_polyedra.AAC.1